MPQVEVTEIIGPATVKTEDRNSRRPTMVSTIKHHCPKKMETHGHFCISGILQKTIGRRRIKLKNDCFQIINLKRQFFPTCSRYGVLKRFVSATQIIAEESRQWD